MFDITLITVGKLKEKFYLSAAAEYEKRLCAFCKPTLIQLKEAKLPENPSEGEIRAALADEGERILAAMPPRSYRIALCVEGKTCSSEQLAELVAEIPREGKSEITLIIGSSHGLAPEVKAACARSITYRLINAVLFGSIRTTGLIGNALDQINFAVNISSQCYVVHTVTSLSFSNSASSLMFL